MYVRRFYQMAIDPSEKDALSHVPNAGPTTSDESLEHSTKADRGRNGFWPWRRIDVRQRYVNLR